ncbi:MAG: hypothetical protein CMC55_08120 [Flavobacteriaceae bacterium]|nr:hypothetical protein [Flavobacteriaceae bacterium]
MFASGRTQIITSKEAKPGVSQASLKTTDVGSRKGKMAVLPFKIITNMPSVDQESIGRQIQSDCANSIREEAPMIDVIDTRIVNATLAKNNISVESLDLMLPKDLAILLGVEHVVLGSYDIENTGTRSTGSSVTTYNEKKGNKKDKGVAVSSGSSTTSDTFDSRITMDIYNDQGSSIYSVSRKPFSSGLDKYHSTINYLVKRAPFGSKR